MLQSRVALIGRLVANQLRTRGAPIQQQSIRHGHGTWNYRQGPPPESFSPFVRYGSHIIAGLMWWWVIWHIWHEPDHITGEYPEPDPRIWTDKELGIPPDDEE